MKSTTATRFDSSLAHRSTCSTLTTLVCGVVGCTLAAALYGLAVGAILGALHNNMLLAVVVCVRFAIAGAAASVLLWSVATIWGGSPCEQETKGVAAGQDQSTALPYRLGLTRQGHGVVRRARAQ